MNILYVARHGPHDNDDEDAIAHGLRELGHNVRCCQEAHVHMIKDHDTYDFALFHKFEDLNLLDSWPKSKPKCFWYFDLIEHEHFELRQRSVVRNQWAERAIQVFDLGFMTDGDWAARYPEKTIHLMQGADERVIGVGKPIPTDISILFTGTTIHGAGRISFCKEMNDRYGKQFRIVGERYRERIHGRKLANLMASVKIVVAPDSPVTSRYWSNRVYQALGFGAFLLHPLCHELAHQYKDNLEIIFYRTRSHLHELIEHYLDPRLDNIRRGYGLRGLARTQHEHLYRHRCEQLVNTMKLRFGL